MKRHRYSTDARIDEFIRRLLTCGWVVKSTNRHVKLQSPEGRLLVAPVSPSDRRCALNFLSDARHAGVPDAVIRGPR